MDLTKKRSNRYAAGVYAVLIILFAFTVSLFFNSRCQKSPPSSKPDDDILKPKMSTENLQKVTKKIDTPEERSKKTFDDSKSYNLTDDEISDGPLSNKDFSKGPKTNIKGVKTPSGAALSQGKNQIQEQPSLISSGQNVVIYFSTDSTGLTDDAIEKLQKIREFLLKHPDEEIIIEGYGDSSADYRHDKKLSELRANVVKSYLEKQGISSSRLQIFWMGFKNPSGDDDSQKKADKNHQVEISF
jgi:outer membrane protein OmpA-like peptidoglycan-associated protein